MREMMFLNPVMAFIWDGKGGKKIRTFIQSGDLISPLFFFRVLGAKAF